MLYRALVKSLDVGRNSMIIQKRTITASPPLVRMSFTNKMFVLFGMGASMFSIPAWVLLNLKYYNKSAFSVEE